MSLLFTIPIPYICFFPRVTKFAEIGKICSMFDLRQLFLGDIKVFAKKVKIRSLQKLPDIQYIFLYTII